MVNQLEIKIIEEIDGFTADQIIEFTSQVPEFEDSYAQEEYIARMAGKKSLVLFAYLEQQPVGFKLGYEQHPLYFYSWMGAVLPQFRKQGVAKILAKAQENWACQNSFKFIRMKTRNYLKNMLHFALSNDFYITGIEPHPDPMNNRILLEKILNK